MTAQTEQTPLPRPRVSTLVWRAARLLYAWAGAVYCIAYIDLGLEGGMREIAAHVRGEPDLMLAAAIAVMLGWFAATPASKPGESWIYRRPLLAQALVATLLAAGVAVMLLLLR